MSKKIAHILTIIGIILIVSGLVITIVKDKNKIKECESAIELKDELIEQQGRTIIKLKAENEALWDNYYMNASEYDGEYYE